MKTLLFIYDHRQPDMWKDGLWAATELLAKSYNLIKLNLATDTVKEVLHDVTPDFILGWGAFNSPVDNFIQLNQYFSDSIPRGLCLAGNTFPYSIQKYNVIFYETEWSKKWLLDTARNPITATLIHAFGYNADYMFPVAEDEFPHMVFDYMTVGAFATWKRQEKILEKKGLRLAVGEIQKDNLPESMGIIGPLLMKGVMVSDMVSPLDLADLYRSSAVVYIPADEYGGGERAVLEAQACGTKVEIEDDNPKLQELLGKTWDHHYYAVQLQKGIDA